MVQISNLYGGLVAWATGPFVVGQRCSNAGNAYRCTSPGTSTTPPIGTGSAVGGGGGTVFQFLSTVDFTSPQAWANSLPATPTQPIILNVDGQFTTTSGVPLLTLSGHATTPSNSITIQAAPWVTLQQGPLAFNSAAAPSFVLPASGVGSQNYFNVSDNYVTFKGLQFKDPNPSSGSTILLASATFTAFGCIFDGYSQGGGAYMMSPALTGPSGSVFSLINCLVVDRAASGVNSATIRTNYSVKLVNNTFIGVNSPAVLGLVTDVSTASGTAITLTNNIALGYPTASVALFTTSSSTTFNTRYGLYSAPSFTNSRVTTGVGNIFSAPITGQFVNPATDFNLVPLGQGNNTALTDTADLPSAVDIFGNARIPPWDMGCAQLNFPASVGAASGQASSQAVAAVGVTRGAGTAAGQASSQGVPFTYSAGTAGGQASSQGVSTANVSIGSASGQASVQGFSFAGAIEGVIALDGISQQVVQVPFQVSGTLTLLPDLQTTDDSGTVFTRISDKDVSPLGSTDFEFTHPGVPTLGAHNILVEDLSTAATAAANYDVGLVVAHPPFTGTTLTSLATIIPAYVYQEYSDDLNVAAFFQAYNNLAQGYLDYLNNLNLPIYQRLSGALLDWVGAGLYGIPRPVLSLSTPPGGLIGPFNTYQLSEIAINTLIGTVGSSTSISVTDDIYKRIITWDIYKGDGTTFTATWLKRRVMRFLAGTNGTDYIGPTVQVSVSYTGFNTINVAISAGAVELTMAPVLQLAVLTGAISIPFQYTLNVLV